MGLKKNGSLAFWDVLHKVYILLAQTFSLIHVQILPGGRHFIIAKVTVCAAPVSCRLRVWIACWSGKISSGGLFSDIVVKTSVWSTSSKGKWETDGSGEVTKLKNTELTQGRKYAERLKWLLHCNDSSQPNTILSGSCVDPSCAAGTRYCRVSKHWLGVSHSMSAIYSSPFLSLTVSSMLFLSGIG
jgi:hypothetical protein